MSHTVDSKAEAMKSILDNYQSLEETLDIVVEGNDEYARRATGLLARMQKFNTYFGLKLSFELFSVTEILSTTLQSKATTCNEASNGVDITINHLSRMRSDEHCCKFFDEVMEAAQELQCDPPTASQTQTTGSTG